ncbi:MAG: HAD family hydrolase [Chloroflexi bacterium]|nr:HAD family hydrolase [Chloroflexota bacterium]MBU1751811.1 HAD family hydrolase [Chloroflexota bacterium]MBU1877898.1 HAD family hydrolase [Chloroflexota bacterium]
MTARRIRVVFLDLHGVLVDGRALTPQYGAAQARILAARYGGEVADWIAARRQAMRGWQDEWADLDLHGPDGADALLEGWSRNLMANLRAMGVQEDPAVVRRWAPEVSYQVTRQCSVHYGEVPGCLRRLQARGLTLAVISNAHSSHVRGVLEGSDLAQYLDHAWGPDALGLGVKNAEAYRRALALLDIGGEECLVVDDNASGILAAREIGALAVLVDRPDTRERPGKDEARRRAHRVVPDLVSLLDRLEGRPATDR